MKINILLSIVAAAAVTIAVVQTLRISGLKERADTFEQERIKLLMEMLCPGGGDVVEVVGINPESAYRRAVDAYQARDLVALRTALSLCNNCPIEVERLLLSPFNRSFLRTDILQDFERVEDFERFSWVNTEVSMFFGVLYARGREFDVLTCLEELSFLRFRKYKEKFQAEGKKELEQVAQRFMDLWIAHIESPEGFTRIGLRGLIRRRTELDEAVRPRCGVSREDVNTFGRGMAMGLVRCGYTPKWLDVEFPLPESDKNSIKRNTR